jgi:hypothetical protein
MVLRKLTIAVPILAHISLAHAWATFIVPHSVGQDDTSALANVLSSGNLSANTTILFEKGVTYNIFTPLKFPKFTNVEVAIEGNLTYPNNISAVQGTIYSITLTVIFDTDLWN